MNEWSLENLTALQIMFAAGLAVVPVSYIVSTVWGIFGKKGK